MSRRGSARSAHDSGPPRWPVAEGGVQAGPAFRSRCARDAREWRRPRRAPSLARRHSRWAADRDAEGRRMANLEDLALSEHHVHAAGKAGIEAADRPHDVDALEGF